MVLSEKQREEECRLTHEAERLKLLEERMRGSAGGSLAKEGGATSAYWRGVRQKLLMP